MAKLVTLCSCGTPLTNPRQATLHKRGEWHKIAKEARYYRSIGMSYSWIARHVKSDITSQGIAWHLQKEGLTSYKKKAKV